MASNANRSSDFRMKENTAKKYLEMYFMSEGIRIFTNRTKNDRDHIRDMMVDKFVEEFGSGSGIHIKNLFDEIEGGLTNE